MLSVIGGRRSDTYCTMNHKVNVLFFEWQKNETAREVKNECHGKWLISGNTSEQIVKHKIKSGLIMSAFNFI